MMICVYDLIAMWQVGGLTKGSPIRNGVTGAPYGIMEKEVDKKRRGLVQQADKYARDKAHTCLLPGCTSQAIRSHAIQKASCLDALAENGQVYTLLPSYNMAMRMGAPNDPLDVVPVGIKDASIFKGFCAEHDSLLFAPAELPPGHKRRRSAGVSFHLRALALEYCRKRQSADFFRKLWHLEKHAERKARWQTVADEIETFMAAFEELYLGSIVNFVTGHGPDAIDYVCIAFGRNLAVSACGVVAAQQESFDSMLGYNLVSYAMHSLLVLTTFKAVGHYLDDFLVPYYPADIERLVNDIVFWHSEEPLISPRLWDSLTEAEKFAVRLALRAPIVRMGTEAPRIIKLPPTNLCAVHEIPSIEIPLVESALLSRGGVLPQSNLEERSVRVSIT